MDMRKRGQANILVTILIITITIIAVVIVFNIIKPLVSEKGKEIETKVEGFLLTQLTAEDWTDNGDGTVNIIVSASAGRGNVIGVRFILYTPEDHRCISEQYFEPPMQPLETKNFIVPKESCINVANIGVYPIYGIDEIPETGAQESIQTIEIDSCQELTQEKTIYKLTGNLFDSEVTAKCINIKTKNITLDCQGYSIKNSNLEDAVIYSQADYVTIKNCNVSAKMACQTCGAGQGINIAADYNLIENNTIKDTFWGIAVSGNNNLIQNNWVEGNAKGIHLEDGQYNIVKNNLVKNNNQYQGWGLGVWSGHNNQFINNKVYGNNYGIVLYDAAHARLECEKYSSNSRKDIYVYAVPWYSWVTGTSNDDIIATGISYSSKYVGSGAQFSEISGDCSAYCTWTGDECKQCYDKDKDGYGAQGTDLIYCTSTTEHDCNDDNPFVNPITEEICGDSIDNNCNNEIDENCIPISFCQTLTESGKTYYLIGDIFGPASGNCISIINNNIALDCMDFKSGFKIGMNDITNIIIKNCNLSSVSGNRNSNITLFNNTLRSVSLYDSSSHDIYVINNNIIGGMALYSESYIFNNIFNSSSYYSLLNIYGNFNLLKDNVFHFTKINIIGSNNSLINNSISDINKGGSSTDGVIAIKKGSWGNEIINNTIKNIAFLDSEGYDGYGIFFSEGNNSYNLISGNNITNISTENPSSPNGACGGILLKSGSNNRIINNNINLTKNFGLLVYNNSELYIKSNVFINNGVADVFLQDSDYNVYFEDNEYSTVYGYQIQCVENNDCSTGMICEAGTCVSTFVTQCGPFMNATWSQNLDVLADGVWDWSKNPSYLEVLPSGTDYILRAVGEIFVHRYDRVVGENFNPSMQTWGGTAYVNVKNFVSPQGWMYPKVLDFIGGYRDSSGSRDLAVQIGKDYDLLTGEFGKKYICFRAYEYSAEACNSRLDQDISRVFWIPDGESGPNRFIRIDWFLTPNYNLYARVDEGEWRKISPLGSARINFTKFAVGWVSSYGGGSIDIKNVVLYNQTCVPEWVLNN